jgi:hypothetical protein
MKILLALAIVWATPNNGSTQVVGLREGPAFHIAASENLQTGALPALSTDAWREVIQNQGSSSLEALFAFFPCGSGANVTIYDTLLAYGVDKSILPSGSVEISAGDPSKCSGGVQAAIFSDDHAEGNPEALKQLYERRKGLYAGLDDSIKLLDAIVANQQKSADVIDILDSRIVESRKIQTPTSVGYITACMVVRNTLQSANGRLHVPSDDTPQKLPKPEALMSQEGISWDQARAKVLSQKLGQWQSALSDHLQEKSLPGLIRR